MTSNCKKLVSQQKLLLSSKKQEKTANTQNNKLKAKKLRCCR